MSEQVKSRYATLGDVGSYHMVGSDDDQRERMEMLRRYAWVDCTQRKRSEDPTEVIAELTGLTMNAHGLEVEAVTGGQRGHRVTITIMDNVLLRYLEWRPEHLKSSQARR